MKKWAQVNRQRILWTEFLKGQYCTIHQKWNFHRCHEHAIFVASKFLAIIMLWSFTPIPSEFSLSSLFFSFEKTSELWHTLQHRISLRSMKWNIIQKFSSYIWEFSKYGENCNSVAQNFFVMAATLVLFTLPYGLHPRTEDISFLLLLINASN